MLCDMTARSRGECVRAADRSRTYRTALAAVWPIVDRWGRLQVFGAEQVPQFGPLLLVANHDSAWDPLVIAEALGRRRQIRALARSSLWSSHLLGRVLDAMGQIPLDRGQQDAQAMGRAVAALASGSCIGVFPEGTVSRGRQLRARSGVGRLALAVPEARVVCAAVTGGLDIARFPRRPWLCVTFFLPPGGGMKSDESPAAFSARIMAEIRLVVPVPAYP